MLTLRSRWSPLRLACCGLLLSAAACAFAAPQVTITKPKENARVANTFTVQADTSASTNFGYAILYIDTKGFGVSNALPISFQVDAATLANGTHELRIDLADLAGSLASSKPVHVQVGAAGKPALAKPKPLSAEERTALRSKSEVAALVARTAGLSFTLDGDALVLALPPYIEDGRVMVWVRPLVDAMKGTITWDNSGKQATVRVAELGYGLYTDSNSVVALPANPDLSPGVKTLLRPTALKDGRLYVPITAWRDLFGGSVQYDATSGTVALRSHDDMEKAKLASAR